MSQQWVNDLAALWGNCRKPNWDGHEALPVSAATLRKARDFLDSLPAGTRPPSIGAEPDGSVTLDWHRCRDHTLSVSIAPTGELHFAALLGPNRKWGTEEFVGDAPNTILDLIRQVDAD